ncbi:MAG: AAA family ATPase [Spirochaetes bacterium]|nr:AAA family ATPase [Spirochaetota bacterium]
MKRIIIIGNSGSGKTWLGSRISEINNIQCYGLDSIFWEPGSFNRKRNISGVETDIGNILQLTEWIVEGVFGDLVDYTIQYADTLIYLDMPWEECKGNLLSRGSERLKQKDPEQAEKSFQALLKWASEYYTRQSKASKNYHSKLFDDFSGRKILLRDRDASYRFLNHIEADLLI